MLHTRRLFTTPDADSLAEVLTTEERLIEEVLFRTLELTALVESGQHRFIGRALDDLEAAEFSLGEAELARAAITEAMLGSMPGHEPSLTEVLEAVDSDRRDGLSDTAERIRTTLDELSEVRTRATATATERIARARRAQQTAASDTGLYGRA